MEQYDYNLNEIEIENKYQTNLQDGLTKSEASNRLETNGPNELDQAKRRHPILLFVDQLKDFMIIILFAAAILSMFTGDIAEGILIIIIVIVNAVLGVVQEAKAEKSLEALKQLSTPHATVIRDGEAIVIDVSDVVVGDLVVLKAGDFVPADVRIIESVNLQIDESSLTGEAIPVEKTSKILPNDTIALGDQKNSGFMSTVITYGRGLGIVTKTGMDTEVGKIATMIQDAETESTPLQRSINKLGKVLAIIALSITGFIFLVDIVQDIIIDGINNIDVTGSILFSVSLAVAAIPEGLPAIITVVLSLGMTNLSKQKAIMKTLPAAETLGSTSVICSDKTGTLTQNIMTVTKVFINNKEIDINGKSDDKDLIKLATYGTLVNDTNIYFEDEELIRIGDPTEIALVDLSYKLGLNPVEIKDKNNRVYEYPFDSKRKLMTTIHNIDGKNIAIIKGAPDVMFNRVKNIDINNELIFNNKSLQTYIDANDKMSNDALRVLAIGYKILDDNNEFSQNDVENNITLLGLTGMIDIERPEVKDAISLCKTANIKTIMITGDHINTAVAIAKNIGIYEDGNLAITGLELDKLSDEEFYKKADHIKVYARVSPENKVRIVRMFKDKGEIVAMTGDGVNDAPSIKEANIGIAMGITGTEVAKGASDMVLTDDNFATIVNAVSEGRGIFNNLKKAIHYLLSCNTGEIISMFLGVTIGYLVFGFKVLSSDGLSLVPGTVHVLIASQILWVNLVTDSLMALALGLEPKEPNIMEQAPRDTSKSIFSDGLGKRIIMQGTMIGLLTFIAYLIGYKMGEGLAPDTHIRIAQTMAFMVLSMSQLFHAFNTRSTKYSTFSLKRNNYLIGAFIISIILQLLTVSLPFTQKLFHTTNLNLVQWLIVFGLSVIPLVLVETIKFIRNKKETKFK